MSLYSLAGVGSFLEAGFFAGLGAAAFLSFVLGELDGARIIDVILVCFGAFPCSSRFAWLRVRLALILALIAELENVVLETGVCEVKLSFK